MTDLSGRTCLITGATSGHGRAVVRGLARMGADVVLHGRSEERLFRTRSEIETLTGRVPEILVADLASRADVDRMADTFLSWDRPLHVLVNNAGLVCRTRQETPDGVEMTFGVNYLAHFQLTRRLLDRMAESGKARIVNVSSDTHRTVTLDLDDLELRSGYGVMRAYGLSKLCIVHFTLELARRLEGSLVTVNACDPGPVTSNIGQNNPGAARKILKVVMKLAFPSAEKAARTALHLASSPELEGVSGRYFKWCRERRPRVPADPAVGRRLWDISVGMLES